MAKNSYFFALENNVGLQQLFNIQTYTTRNAYKLTNLITH